MEKAEEELTKEELQRIVDTVKYFRAHQELVRTGSWIETFLKIVS